MVWQTSVRGIHTEEVCHLKWSLLPQMKSSSCNGCRSFVFYQQNRKRGRS